MSALFNKRGNATMLTNDYITVQAAIDLGISRRLLKHLIGAGKIRAATTGLNRVKVLKADVIKAMGIDETDTQRAA